MTWTCLAVAFSHTRFLAVSGFSQRGSEYAACKAQHRMAAAALGTVTLEKESL